MRNAKHNMTRIAGLAGLATLVLTPGAHAQGCVLCYTSIAAAGSAAMHNFEIAMLVLLIPALALFAAVFLLIWRRAAEADGVAAEPSLKLTRLRRFALRFARPAEGRL